MPLPVYSAEDYLGQFLRLLPRGRVWLRGWGEVQQADILTLMPVWARLGARLNDLITQIFPCTTTELLPEWEASLGLPDPCTGPLGTIQQRTAAVCAKFSARGGVSRAYFERLAASLGFEIAIETFVPFTVGRSRVGDHLFDEKWAWAWQVTASETQVVYFRVGQSTVGEPLATWGNQLLECEIRAHAPADTTPIFSYTLDETIWDDGATIWDDGATIWDQGLVVPSND
jgi:uncharacterized protein YmfQ (DUF2313 family)